MNGWQLHKPPEHPATARGVTTGRVDSGQEGGMMGHVRESTGGMLGREVWIEWQSNILALIPHFFGPTSPLAVLGHYSYSCKSLWRHIGHQGAILTSPYPHHCCYHHSMQHVPLCARGATTCYSRAENRPEQFVFFWSFRSFPFHLSKAARPSFSESIDRPALKPILFLGIASVKG